jgi:hypothetical protein
MLNYFLQQIKTIFQETFAEVSTWYYLVAAGFFAGDFFSAGAAPAKARLHFL